MDREQIEQMSLAKNAELNDAKKTIMELRNQLTDSEKTAETLTKTVKDLKGSGQASAEETRYLK
jgi:hypothetical protein